MRYRIPSNHELLVNESSQGELEPCLQSAPKKYARNRVNRPDKWEHNVIENGPKGSRDITGGKKEGGRLGELGGAINVGISPDAVATPAK